MEEELKLSEKPEESIYRWLTDVYFQLQKIRIGLGNRNWAVENNRDLTDNEASKFRHDLFDKIEEAENLVSLKMVNEIVNHPVWPWLSEVKGVGPALGTQLLGLAGDISRAPSISSFWKFCGYGVDEEGKADRLKKGEKSPYNKRLKSVVWKVGTSFLKCNSPYRKIYDKWKEYYFENRTDWTAKHIHLASMRKMEKMFLSHLWLKWREAEGLPTSKPWAIEHGGHVHYISPEDIINS